ncbi:MAG: response regulator transcription factor [Pseudomonadota bacterium]
MIRLLLADDHAIFLQGLTRLLDAWPEARIVAEAADGQEAWNLILKHNPDVAVVDIKMPQMSGIEIAEHVRARGLSTRVLVLTMHDEPALALEAEQAGVDGYVLKDNTFEELSEAIKTVFSGHRYISPSVAENLHAFRLKSGGVSLSPREREVLTLIASGLSSKAIARQLGISPKTVETHRSRLMTKLNLHSVAELVRYAVQTGFLPDN